jgi:uncharacterized membrane protein
MRSCTMLAFCALAASTAVPDTADARSPFSILTSPLRSVMRAVPGMGGRRIHHRRTAARAYASQGHQATAVERTAVERSPGGGAAEGGRTARPPGPAAPFNAYEDIIGYALWPDEYAARFWAHGYGDIMRSVLTPAAVTAAIVESGPTTRHHRKRPARASDADVAGGLTASGMCGVQVEQEAGKPIERIDRTIDLNDAQRANLRELREAVSTAVARGQSACRDTLPATPADRLKAAADALWAIRDADILFRTPLANFYATLTDAQKAKLAEGLKKDEAKNDDAKKDDGGEVAQVCGAAANDLPFGEIERMVRPSQDQRASLDMLKTMSNDMAGYLAASCPNEPLNGPVARLDAAGNRVNALLYAAINFNQVLGGFYLQLNDDQKKQFDSVGRR